MRIGDLWPIVRAAGWAWQQDRAPRLGAAIAFYMIFSLAPLLVIVVAISGAVFGEDAAWGRLSHELQGILGDRTAEAVEAMVLHASREVHGGRTATLLGVVVMVFGAVGVFAELKDSLNVIWKVEPKPGLGFMQYVWDYLTSFAMVVGIACLLLASLLFGAVVAFASEWLSRRIAVPASTLVILDWTAALALTIVLFAALFKFLPDASIAWRDVWIGAITTALLFSAGKTLLGYYLGRAAAMSTFGAAGSVVVLLTWTYYSAQIVLFGAELTQVVARHYGSGIQPAVYAQSTGMTSAQPPHQPRSSRTPV